METEKKQQLSDDELWQKALQAIANEPREALLQSAKLLHNEAMKHVDMLQSALEQAVENEKTARATLENLRGLFLEKKYNEAQPKEPHAIG